MDKKNKLTLDSIMYNCLLALADGKNICDMDYPNFRKIKVKIIGISFRNINWKPINVKILEKGLTKEVDDFEPQPFSEDGIIKVKKNISFIEEWVDVRWLSNYTYETKNNKL